MRSRSSRLFIVLIHLVGVSTNLPHNAFSNTPFWQGIRGVHPMAIFLESLQLPPGEGDDGGRTGRPPPPAAGGGVRLSRGRCTQRALLAAGRRRRDVPGTRRDLRPVRRRQPLAGAQETEEEIDTISIDSANGRCRRRCGFGLGLRPGAGRCLRRTEAASGRRRRQRRRRRRPRPLQRQGGRMPHFQAGYRRGRQQQPANRLLRVERGVGVADQRRRRPQPGRGGRPPVPDEGATTTANITATTTKATANTKVDR